MRIASLISAIGVTLATSATSATPLNGTVSNATIASHTTPFGLIPVSHVFCFDLPLPRKEYETARDIMVKAEYEGRKIGGGSFHRVSFPLNSPEGVTLIVCNHKKISDVTNRVEMDQVRAVIEEECGEGTSGRVRSKKWLKQWVIAPQAYQKVQDQLQRPMCKCPLWWFPCHQNQ